MPDCVGYSCTVMMKKVMRMVILPWKVLILNVDSNLSKDEVVVVVGVVC